MPLPALPRIDIVVEKDEPVDRAGFLRPWRRRLVARYPDGTQSAPFLYDGVDRPALDAVVIAAHYRDRDGARWVFLRSALRPPAALRPLAARPLAEKPTLGVLWELPAGLVEAAECNPTGLGACAARELDEELGFALPPARFSPLGHAVFPSAGVIGERHHFFQVEVDPGARGTPAEDGSVLESRALVAALPLAEALALVRSGDIEDAKTEIGLRRLAEV